MHLQIMAFARVLGFASILLLEAYPLGFFTSPSPDLPHPSGDFPFGIHSSFSRSSSIDGQTRNVRY